MKPNWKSIIIELCRFIIAMLGGAAGSSIL